MVQNVTCDHKVTSLGTEGNPKTKWVHDGLHYFHGSSRLAG